jgi:DNA-binding response OmpR family regulator
MQVVEGELMPSDPIQGVRLGRATIDLQSREIRWSRRQRGELSETEAAILNFLLANQNRAVTRDELLTNVWGISPDGLETRTIDMHIARLRTKLRDPSGKNHVQAIVTVRSQGYMAGPALTPLLKVPNGKA